MFQNLKDKQSKNMNEKTNKKYDKSEFWIS